MAITEPDLFRLAQDRLNWLDRRQALLARNIANADTPGYTPRDLVPFARALARASLAPVRTSPLHLAGETDAGAPERQDQELEAQAPDGNAVSLSREMIKVADTANAHQLVTSLYQAWAGMMRTALGRS